MRNSRLKILHACFSNSVFQENRRGDVLIFIKDDQKVSKLAYIALNKVYSNSVCIHFRHHVPSLSFHMEEPFMIV